MKRTILLRRIGILCCHCLRNIAFYRAGWRGEKLNTNDQFWITANGNFLDIAVLEWCKLFADSRGEHFWRKAISDPEKFFQGLLTNLGLQKSDFEKYITLMREYRDKFVAHLDKKEVMNIPDLKVSIDSTTYLYDYLLEHEEEDDCLSDGPKSGSSFFDRFFNQGSEVYDKIMT